MISTWTVYRRALLAAAVAVSVLAPDAQALAPVSDEAMETYSRAAVLASRKIARYHVKGERFDDDLAREGLLRFLSLLDFDHSVFLASDVEAFRARASLLDDQVRGGDLSVAFEIYDVYMERLTNRLDFVDELLEQGFQFDREETYRWRRHDAPWPETPGSRTNCGERRSRTCTSPRSCRRKWRSRRPGMTRKRISIRMKKTS
jgi:carboxyl-terminal processing protease